MPYLLVRHKVKDYAAWKPVFDQHSHAREDSGSKGGYVFRDTADPQNVLILLEWDDIQKAREFVESSNLNEVMEQAGVADKPDVFFLETIDRPKV
jgi:heme-degrading monooxygenase HmoA